MNRAVVPVAGGVMIRVRVQPRAPRSEIVGLHGDAIRIRLAAPPVDGAANDALLELLARTLGIAPSLLELKSGHRSRSKTVLVQTISVGQIMRQLGLPVP